MFISLPTHSNPTPPAQPPPSPREAYKAAVKGKWTTVHQFYSTSPSSPINAFGDTILHVLSLNRHTNIIRALLQLQLPAHDALFARNRKGNTPLHEAIKVGSMGIVQLMVEKDQTLLLTYNSLGERPLFFAAAHGKKKILRFLYEKNNHEDLLKREDLSTILHAAVIGEFFDLALEIIALRPSLALTCNSQGVTALHLLAQLPSSFRSGTIYSWKNIGSSGFIPLQILVVFIYIWIEIYTRVGDVLELGGVFKNEDTTGIPSCKYRTQDRRNMGVMDIGCNFLTGLKWIIRWNGWLSIVDEAKNNHNYAQQLGKKLIMLQAASSMSFDGTEIKEPLVLATKHGIVELVEKILEEFPEAVELSDHNGRNIIHVAVQHRSHQVFSLLKSKNFPMDRMVSEVDGDENTPLHLAAKLGEKQPNNVHGVFQKMSWEVYWFVAVEAISMPCLLRHKNSDGDIAAELFNVTHQKMLSDAEEWVKNMSNTFMLISILIATINFQAAFTVPGGFNQNEGYPIFLGDPAFDAFLFFISVALFFSLISLSVAFSIHLSAIHPAEYYLSLPLKFFFGGTAFFGSAICTLVAYVQAIRLETSHSITGLGLLGNLGMICSQVVTFLIYIDVMYPIFVICYL